MNNDDMPGLPPGMMEAINQANRMAISSQLIQYGVMLTGISLREKKTAAETVKRFKEIMELLKKDGV